MGSAPDSWRATQTRDRCRADQRSQVHGAKARASVAGLEGLSSQSCRRHRRHGPVRGANGVVPALIRSVDHGSWPTTDPVAWRNGTSECGMARQSTHTCLRLGSRSQLIWFGTGMPVTATSSPAVSDASNAAPYSAAYITNTRAFDLRQGQGHGPAHPASLSGGMRSWALYKPSETSPPSARCDTTCDPTPTAPCAA